MLNSPVFIVGCPRSGTTLLQCMLSASDDFFSMPETHFFCSILPSLNLTHKDILNSESLREVIQRVCRKMEFEWPEAAYAEIEKLPQTEGLSAGDFFIRLVDQFRPKIDVQKKLRPIEKTPFHFRFLEQIFECFPSTFFISVVRNPLDVVSSRLAIPSSAKTPVENLAVDWNKSQEAVHRFSVKNPDRMYILRYEDLVAKPEEMLRQLCRFLGVSYQQRMLSHFADQYPSCTTTSEKPWKNNVQIGQILNRSGVWRSRIPIEKAALILKITMPWAKRHNYYTDAVPIVADQMGKVESIDEIAGFMRTRKSLENGCWANAFKDDCRDHQRAICSAAGSPGHPDRDHCALKNYSEEPTERPAEQTPSKDDRSMITTSTGSFSRTDMRLVFLDPGFRTEFGHYRNYAHQLREEARRRRIEMMHLVSRSVKEDEALQFDAQRLFVSSVYVSDRANSREIDLSLHQFAAKLCPAIKLATEGALGRQVVLYMYTASPFHLPLVAEAIHEACFSKYNVKAFICLFYLDLPFCLTGSNPAYEKRLKDMSERLERLDPGRRLNICADSERTIARYAPFFKRPLTLIPVPLAAPTEPKPPAPDPNNIHLLYSGYTHPKQGYFMVKNLYDTIRADKRYAHVKFFVRHLIRFEGQAERRRIEEFLGAREGIVHETGTLEEGDYHRLYEGCDVVLLPYSRKYYPTQTSGALVDALSRGRIVVAPDDTWLSDQVCRFEAGETFRSDDSKSFRDAVLKIIHNIADYRAKARGHAATFSRFHSAATLFDIVVCSAAAEKKIKMPIFHDPMVPAA